MRIIVRAKRDKQVEKNEAPHYGVLRLVDAIEKRLMSSVSSLSHVIIAIQRSIGDGLQQVIPLDRLASLDVGYRARELKDTVVGTRGETEFGHGYLHDALAPVCRCRDGRGCSRRNGHRDRGYLKIFRLAIWRYEAESPETEKSPVIAILFVV